MSVAVRIEFDTEWRLGTGQPGIDGSDDGAWVDGVGPALPVITGSHFKRKLSRSAQDVAEALGQDVCTGRLPGTTGLCTDTEGAGPCLLCRIFGSPAVEFSSWDFSETFRVDTAGLAEADVGRLGRAMRRRRTRNRHDPHARRVAQDQFFSEDEVPAVALEGRIIYDGPGDPPRDELRILCAAVGALDALGAGTTRAMGQCRAWVVSVGDDHSADVHDQLIAELIGGTTS